MAFVDEDTPRDPRYNAIFCDEEGKAHVAELAYDLRQTAEPPKRWQAATELDGLGLTVGIVGSKAFADTIQDFSVDDALRMQASRTLAKLGPVAGDTGARALAKTLLREENDLFIRTTSALCLGKLTSDAGAVGVLGLTRALEVDRDVQVRRQAATSLGEIGPDVGVRVADRAAVPALTKGLVDSDVTVRWRSAESFGALGELSGDAGAEALAQALREDVDTGSRRRVAVSLGKMGATAGKSTSALVYALHNDTHDIVKKAARESMDQICIASVNALSGSQHDYVRGRAAWAIGELGDYAGEQAVSVLLVALTNETELYVRRRVLESLGKVGKSVGEVGAAALLIAFDDADAFIAMNSRFIYEDLGIKSTDAGVDALHVLFAADQYRRALAAAEGEADADASSASGSAAAEEETAAAAEPEEEAEGEIAVRPMPYHARGKRDAGVEDSGEDEWVPPTVNDGWKAQVAAAELKEREQAARGR